MKNGVKRYKDFFPYFKALKTNCVGVASQKHHDQTDINCKECNCARISKTFLQACHILGIKDKEFREGNSKTLKTAFSQKLDKYLKPQCQQVKYFQGISTKDLGFIQLHTYMYLEEIGNFVAFQEYRAVGRSENLGVPVVIRWA